jgi:hypothetical protein
MFLSDSFSSGKYVFDSTFDDAREQLTWDFWILVYLFYGYCLHG